MQNIATVLPSENYRRSIAAELRLNQKYGIDPQVTCSAECSVNEAEAVRRMGFVKSMDQGKNARVMDGAGGVVFTEAELMKQMRSLKRDRRIANIKIFIGTFAAASGAFLAGLSASPIVHGKEPNVADVSGIVISVPLIAGGLALLSDSSK